MQPTLPSPFVQTQQPQLNWAFQDIVLNISNYLPRYTDIKNFSLSCKQICHIVSTNVFWRQLYLYQSQASPENSSLKTENFEKKFILYSNLSHDDCQSTFIPLSGSPDTCVTRQNKVVAVVRKDCTSPADFLNLFLDKPDPIDYANLDMSWRYLWHNTPPDRNGVKSLEFSLLKILDLTTLEHTTIFPLQTHSLNCLDIYKEMIVLGFKDGLINIWDPKTKKPFRTYKNADAITCLVSDPDHHRIIAGDIQGRIIVWDVETSPFPDLILALPNGIASLVLDQESLLVLDGNNNILLFDLTTKTWRYKIKKIHQHPVADLAIKDNQLFSCAFREAVIKIWDLNALNLKKTVNFSTHFNFHDCVRCTPLGERVFVQGAPVDEKSEMLTVIWNPKTQETHYLNRVISDVLSVTPDGKLIVKWALGLQICDYSIPELQIKYPFLEHLGKDYRKRLGFKPEDLFDNLQTQEDYDRLQELCKPRPSIDSCNKASQIEEIKAFVLSLKNEASDSEDDS